MSKNIYLFIGIILLAALFGCGKAKDANKPAETNANSPNQVNPAGPNDPNAPPPDINAPGGPLSQNGGKPGKPGVDQGGGTTPPPTSTDSAMPMASMGFHGSLLQGNKEQMAALMAEDFRGTMADGSVQNKAQALAAAKDTGLVYSATVSPAVVKGNTATTKGEMTLRSSDPASTAPPQVMHFTDTWRKQGDRWLLAATTITK